MNSIPSTINDYRVELGARILAARLRADLTQGDLATRVGVSQQCMAKWEAGLSAPRASRMDAVIAVLGPLNEEASRPIITTSHEKVASAIAPVAPTVIHELLLAELIINTLQNVLTDEQRLLVAAQLAATGLEGSTPTRSVERRAVITAAGAV